MIYFCVNGFGSGFGIGFVINCENLLGDNDCVSY